MLTSMGLVQPYPEGFGTVLQKLQILLYEQTLLWVLNTHQRST